MLEMIKQGISKGASRWEAVVVNAVNSKCFMFEKFPLLAFIGLKYSL